MGVSSCNYKPYTRGGSRIRPAPPRPAPSQTLRAAHLETLTVAALSLPALPSGKGKGVHELEETIRTLTAEADALAVERGALVNQLEEIEAEPRTPGDVMQRLEQQRRKAPLEERLEGLDAEVQVGFATVPLSNSRFGPRRWEL